MQNVQNEVKVGVLTSTHCQECSVPRTLTLEQRISWGLEGGRSVNNESKQGCLSTYLLAIAGALTLCHGS